jgi:hypothetical protein
MPVEQPVQTWRAEMLALIADGDQIQAADALLSLVCYSPERAWLEGVLTRIIEDPETEQLRALAVTCLGHAARLYGAIDQQVVVPLVKRLISDPVLGGVAQGALDDMDVFARRGDSA